MKRTLTTLFLASFLVPGCESANPPLPITNPPPITGGTLAITWDGLAVAADPDRDVVWVVDLRTREVNQVALTQGDEPGRVVVDEAEFAYVVLRGSGAVARIDARSGEIVNRRQVCPAPRGIAYEAASDVVHVACLGGELVTLPAAGGPPVRSLRLDRDLRDVVVQGDHLLVSRFRAAELLSVSANGKVSGRRSPLPAGTEFAIETIATPTVAWRTLALPAGGAAMVHQMAASTEVGTDSGAYAWGNACGNPVVSSTVTFFEGDGSLSNPVPMPLLDAVLPVDLAADDRGNLAVVSAGTVELRFVGSRASLEGSASSEACNFDSFDSESPTSATLEATPIAVASWEGRWFVQTREHAQIVEVGGDATIASTIELGGRDVRSAGSSIFHASWNGVACASCHPEGREDGHTWSFEGIGARRTQNLSGGVMHRAPFHWRGELASFPALVEEVLVNRMGSDEFQFSGIDIKAFASWLDALPAPPASPTGTPAQIDHGQQLFQDPTVGCSGCHTGAYFTSNQSMDVGTGARFQVASLVGVSARAPFFHDGCAATLQDRFDPTQSSCNGGDLHGHTSQLTAADVGDLIAYLETL
jgi:hypothetical protein